MIPNSNLRRALGRLLLLSSILALPLRAEEVNGSWTMDQPRDAGPILHTVIELHQHGENVEGSVMPNIAAELPIREARVDDEDIVFRVDWGWRFRVHLDGLNLHVAVSYDQGKSEQEYTARPSIPADTQLPAQVAPPALRDLPSNGLALTPPMGWNSWNHFAEGVDDTVVRETADAMVSTGMAAAGYAYINIDDTWELDRGPDGRIRSNRKFPDMKALAAYVHAKGLKIGIYSSPGPVTCGGYAGSYGHEEDDAKTYAEWGIDYLKYDWCSAGRLYTNDQLRRVYQRMGEALARSGRPIVFSLCEYGMVDVWTWGPKVGGNLWRTSGDISDSWKSMENIGFKQGALAPYAGPGHWNDPDMLEVGNGGMTPTEYRTHFSLWCMLAAPLIAGNDLRTMSDDTREILTNREVIAVDQDPLGREATRVYARELVEVWVKPLKAGGCAVAVFNRGRMDAVAAFPWSEVGRRETPASVRDLWRHADLTPSATGFSGRVPSHGVILLAVR